MCGIAGIVTLNRPLEIGLVIEMNKFMKHRGPDDEGYIGIYTKNGNVYHLYTKESQLKEGYDIVTFNEQVDLLMGHRRLSIIDLSPTGHQPMSYDNRKLWIVYNGEVFNYKELREELKLKGYEFKTNTDTEVILASYKEWGESCVKYFNGDWAFAIYDKRKNIIFLSRDRFGIKPLYYFYDPSLKIFAFSSEIKALLNLPFINFSINKEKCFEFLVFGLSDHSKETMYKNIYQLEPGVNLILNLSSFKIKHYKYYELVYNPLLEPYNHKKSLSYADDIRYLLIDAVKIRLRADVPIGTCLSGGLDSSSIVIIVNKLFKEKGVAIEQIGECQKTFTASFPNEPIDESNFAKIIIRHTNAQGYFVYPEKSKFEEEIKKVMWHQEEPFGGLSVYAQFKVMEQASKHVKVILDGQGGDEVFGGYANYRSAFLSQLVKYFKPVRFVNELFGTFKMYDYSFKKTIIALKSMPINLAPNTLKIIFYLLWKRRLINSVSVMLQENFAIPSDFILSFTPNLNKVLYYYQIKYSLPHLLHYEDRNSMAFSIESRTPFTDYRLVDYVFSIPASYKYYRGWSKWLLRLAMRDLLPNEILWRRDKIGFAVSSKMNKYNRVTLFKIWNKLKNTWILK